MKLTRIENVYSLIENSLIFFFANELGKSQIICETMILKKFERGYKNMRICSIKKKKEEKKIVLSIKKIG